MLFLVKMENPVAFSRKTAKNIRTMKPDPARVARNLVLHMSSTLLIPLAVAILPPAEDAWWIFKILGGLFAVVFFGTYISRLGFYKDLLGDAYSAYFAIIIIYTGALLLTPSVISLVLYAAVIFLHTGLIPSITKHITWQRSTQVAATNKVTEKQSEVPSGLTGIWESLVQATRKNRPLISGWVEASESHERIGDAFVLYFSAENKHVLEALQRSHNIQFLQECVLPLSLRLCLKQTISLPLDGAKLDGLLLERAIVLKGATLGIGAIAEHKYLTENYPGYQITKQALKTHNGKSFDEITFTTAQGESKTLYFALTNLVGH